MENSVDSNLMALSADLELHQFLKRTYPCSVRQGLTPSIIGNFACFFVLCIHVFFFILFFKKKFRYIINISQFGSRSVCNYIRNGSGVKLFARVISR